MTSLRKDWVRLPGEDSNFGDGKHIRAGGVIDETDSNIRSRGYYGIVPAHLAIGSKENWSVSVQDEERRVKSKTINDLEWQKKLMTAEFVPLDERFWAALDGKPIMSFGEALDSGHGLSCNSFDFSEPDLDREEDKEEPEPDDEPRLDLSREIDEWIQERYGDVLRTVDGPEIEPEEKIQVFAARRTEKQKIGLHNLKLHHSWSFKRKRAPQKRVLSCRRVRHEHQRIPF